MKAEPETMELVFVRRDAADSIDRAWAYNLEMSRRRSVRDFSSETVPLEALRAAISAAGQAPSGANKQPWTFVLVSDPERRAAIRDAAEREEREFYERRASDTWLDDLAHLGTDWRKPFLTDAGALIVVFSQATDAQGGPHYYVRESVGIATGILLSALHLAGFATLTHTPSPMHFLRELLQRPANERAYMIIPVGYPADGCRVPQIKRRALADILVEM